ncbi:MAG: gamma-glutamyltransferase [Planctomycetes bacterium]|nr:gamma-glutamyltransferase [Planctomycetota bacterium]
MARIRWVAVIALALARVAGAAGAAEEAGWKASGRGGAVAAGKAGSVEAGIAILERGGNAADAAVATILALAITDYRSFCIGAEVPLLYFDAKRGDVEVLCGQGGAPSDPEAIAWYHEHGIPRGGIRAAAVPGAISLCFKALERHGTMPFEDVAAPALALLDRGGETWYGDLAATFRKLIETERATEGAREAKLRAARDRFYRGDIADDLEAWYIEKGSFLRKRDLAAHVTRIEKPVTISYRGYTICKCGPWTQGPYLCQTLRLLETFDLRSMGHLSADYLHVCIEALKLGLADRDAYYGDPLYVRVPLDILLSDAYTRIRVPLIDAKTASREIRPGDPFAMRPLAKPVPPAAPDGGTTTCCVADRWGNVAAATPSGNPPYVDPPGGRTGVTHATRLSSLNTDPDHPNRIQPGKRPRITLTPTIVLKDGRPILAVSVAGGDLQDQVTLNLLLDFIEFGMRPEDAVRAPRFSTGHHQDSFDPNPDRPGTIKGLGSLRLQEGVDPEVIRALEGRGHAVTTAPGPMGHPVMLFIDPATGVIHAAGDPAAGRHAAAIDGGSADGTAGESTEGLASETLLERFSVRAAAAYLDRGAHADEKGCFACHATFSYLPGRSAIDPAAKGVMETRERLERFVEGFVEKPAMEKTGDGSKRAQRILAAVELARHDVLATGHLQPVTRRALDHMWEFQLDDGGVEWLRASEPPSGVDDIWGVAMMAIAAGTAPDGYASTERARIGIEKLRRWFSAHPAADLHERGLSMLANRAIGGLIADAGRDEMIDAFFACQLPDGGWSMAQLAPWKRPDGKPLDPKTSDGYGTAFATYVLREGGVGLGDARLRRAVEWLKTHQRRSGGWFTPSPRNRDALASYAGTSFAILALAACGEIRRPAGGRRVLAPMPPLR